MFYIFKRFFSFLQTHTTLYIDFKVFPIDHQVLLELQIAMAPRSSSKSFSFRSRSQAIATQLVAQKKEDILIILPTGAGKTLCYAAPCVLEVTSVTVVIVPLVALIMDLKGRMESYGLNAEVYSSQKQIRSVTNVLFSSIEHVESEAFQSLLTELHHQKRLSRIVIEECHVVVHWKWRPAMASLTRIRRQPVPLVLLSATVPPFMATTLSEAFGSKFTEIREPCIRADIKFTVTRVPERDSDNVFPQLQLRLCLLLNGLRSRFSHADDRFIVFFMTKQAAISAHLNISKTVPGIGLFHGDLLDAEKSQCIFNWTQGITVIIFATSAFGMGIDYQKVRATIHFGFSYSVLDFVEASGRVSRDGNGGESILLTSTSFIDNIRGYMSSVNSQVAFDEFHSFIMEKHCRQSYLGKVVDGADFSCLLASTASKCDLCESRLSSRNLKRKLPSSPEPNVSIYT